MLQLLLKKLIILNCFINIATAIAKHTPPIEFINKAINELLIASLVCVYPISRNEQSVVTSQKKYIQIKSFDKTIPNIPEKI